VAPEEASSNLARYDGVRYGVRAQARDIRDMYETTRAQGFGPEVRRRVLIGTYVLSAGYYEAYYLRAQKVRTLIKRDFENAFTDGVDAILAPATPHPYLVPVRPTMSRIAHKSGICGSASTVRSAPLILICGM
jgi:aspartyl-tRNA(Asn)/glutamyl-tRNA(Gln) amidotransferase subunit A